MSTEKSLNACIEPLLQRCIAALPRHDDYGTERQIYAQNALAKYVEQIASTYEWGDIETYWNNKATIDDAVEYILSKLLPPMLPDDMRPVTVLINRERYRENPNSDNGYGLKVCALYVLFFAGSTEPYDDNLTVEVWLDGSYYWIQDRSEYVVKTFDEAITHARQYALDEGLIKRGPKQERAHLLSQIVAELEGAEAAYKETSRALAAMASHVKAARRLTIQLREAQNDA